MSDPRKRLIGNIKKNATRVHFSAPPIVLLCGGPIKEKEHPSEDLPPTQSFRHAITRTETSYEVFLPEEIKAWHEDGIYKNLVDFEKDLAGICSLVVIVLESPGSIAELGAFSQLDHLRDRLIVIKSSDFNNDLSFIDLGILRYIKEGNETSVKIYPWKITAPPATPTIADEVIGDAIGDIKVELDALDKSQKFKATDNAHIMALIYDLVKMFVALKEGEILEYLNEFGVNTRKEELRSKLFLLERFQLVKKTHYGDAVFYQKGNNKYHRIRMALADGGYNDRDRTRMECIEFYKNSDRDKHRHRAIQSEIEGGVK